MRIAEQPRAETERAKIATIARVTEIARAVEVARYPPMIFDEDVGMRVATLVVEMDHVLAPVEDQVMRPHGARG